MAFRFSVMIATGVGTYYFGWPMVFGAGLGLLWAVSFNIVPVKNLR